MTTFQHKTLRESVADYIRKMVLRHEITPGNRIVEQELSDKLGVSRGPVREALRQLEQEGLVIYTRNIGCSVRGANLTEIFEAMFLRGSYELTALKACNGKIEPEYIAQMEDVLEAMLTADGSDFAETCQLDNAFHRCLIEAAHMPYLLKAFTDLDFFAFFNYYTETREAEPLVARQHDVHKEILDIYKEGNYEKSREQIAHHYMKFLETKLKENNMTESDLPFSFDILKYK